MKKHIYIFIAAAIAATACSINDLNIEDNAAQQKSNEIGFVLDDTQTKSEITEGLVNKWKAGDAIGVFCEQSEPAVRNAEYIAEMSSGKYVFSYQGTGNAPQWSDAETKHTFSIYYPYAETEDYVLKGFLPKDQTATCDNGVAVTGGTVTENNLMFAKVSGHKTFDGLIPIKEMTRQFGIIEFQIICNDESLAGRSISDVFFYPDTPIPYGNYSFDMNKDNGLVWTGASTSAYSVSVDGLTVSSTHNAKRSVYMLVPPGTSTNGTFAVTIGGKRYGIDRTNLSNTINAGDFYTVTVLMGDEMYSPFGRAWESKWSNEVIDLRKEGEICTGHLITGSVNYSNNTYYGQYFLQDSEPHSYTTEPTGANSGIIYHSGKTLKYSMSGPDEIYFNDVRYIANEDIPEPTSTVPLTAWDDFDVAEPANCFIISTSTHQHKMYFLPLKGATDEIIENVYKYTCTTLGPEPNDISVNTIPFGSGAINLAEVTCSGLWEGKAVICAVDKNDKPLWSWFVWVTNTPYKEGDILGGDYVYYQQGRKDPLYFDGTYSDYVLAFGAFYLWTTANDWNSYAQQNYTKMVMVDYGSSPGSDWGGGSYWRTGEDGAKNIYDPCPYGYKVPTANEAIIRIPGAPDSQDAHYLWYPAFDPMYPYMNEVALKTFKYQAKRDNMQNPHAYWTSTPRTAMDYDSENYYFKSMEFGTATAMPVRCVRDYTVDIQ